MTYFKDLTKCNYFPFKQDVELFAVGWLDSSHQYMTCDVAKPFVMRLTQLLVDPWQPMTTMGWHNCPFCRFSQGIRTFSISDVTIKMGVNNIFVPADNCVFVAPSLIVHYIDAHGYCPPPEFQDAVLACPDMGTMQYLKAIRNHIPKSSLNLE